MIETRADCSRCHALCCVVPPFDAVQGFAEDKPAHQACRHLQADFRCSLHKDLPGHGYPGCAAYDCLGAGPQLLRRLPGPPWSAQADPRALFDAFLLQRRVHAQYALVDLALQRLPDDAEGVALKARLVQAAEAGASAVEVGLLEAASRRWLRSLSSRWAAPPAPG